MIERAAEIFASLPVKRIDEYGFGTLDLAHRVCSRNPWRGFDFSVKAVEHAKSQGFNAQVRRCGDAERLRRSYVCAIATLPNLEPWERDKFLEAVSGAPHAVFGIKRHLEKDAPCYASEEGFKALLRKFWPVVEVEPVGDMGILAHCSRQAIEQTPLLTVGSSTLLDFYGVRYTFADLMTHHGTFGGKVEYVLVDNHPEPTVRLRKCPECERIGKDGPVCATCRKNVEDMQRVAETEGARYIRWDEKQGTYPGKNRLKVEARSPWVLTMDSHVLLSPGTMETVLEVIEKDPESDDFFHFPNLFRSATGGRLAASDHRHQTYIYHRGDKTERGGVYGWTGLAKIPGEPYPIAAMITSCYLVRREAWFTAKGYDPILGNYGGWEGPLQLKWWLMGRRVLSLRHPTQERLNRTPEGFLYHDHLFCKPGDILANETGRVHTGPTKMRNFAASSAVIGGESWVRRHCELKGWDFGHAMVQQGLAEGMKLRPWMVEHLARPEWEDIGVFFQWMKDEQIPGHLVRW